MFKIGNIKIEGKVICAPMAGVTNMAFRKLCSEFGSAFTYTEMTSNVGLKYNSEKTSKYADISKEEGVVALQIFGGSVEDYVDAAKYYDENSNASIIDINMGCPVKKVAIKSEAGSSLMKTPEKIREIIKGIVAVIKKPLTIKIRIGWDEDSLTYLEVAKIAEEEGVAAIAVHGRTRAQMYNGKANWSAIKKIKETVSIPVIGNGDVVTPEDAKRMLDETGVDAVMIARAAQGNPWIFKQVNDYLKTGKYEDAPDIHEVIKMVKRHLSMLEEIKDHHVAFLEIKGASANYFARFKGVNKERQLIFQAKSKDELFDLIENFKNAYIAKHKK